MARLTAPVAIVSGLLLISSIGAAWYVRDMQRTATEMLESNVASVRAAQEVEIAFREVRMRFVRYLLSGDRAQLESMPNLKERTEKALAEAEAVAFTAEEQALMKRARTGHKHFFDTYEELVSPPLPPELERAKVEAVLDDVLRNDILEPTHGYLRLNEEMLVRAERANRQTADRLTFGILTLGLCGSAGGLLAGLAIASSTRRATRRTEARLRLSERDALRAEQVAWAGQTATGLAHEVGRPLAAIERLARTAAERGDGAAFRAGELDALVREIERLGPIVGGLRGFAEPADPEPKPVELGPALAEAAAAVQARAKLQRVAVEVVPPAREVALRIDPTQFRQLLLGLLSNALDAQPEGGRVRLTAGVEAVPGEVPVAVIQVEDEGPGLPQDLGDRIFDPFVGSRGSGLGLGLSIGRRVVRAAGGTIAGTNRPGRGATFTVRLPLGEKMRDSKALLAAFEAARTGS